MQCRRACRNNWGRARNGSRAGADANDIAFDDVVRRPVEPVSWSAQEAAGPIGRRLVSSRSAGERVGGLHRGVELLRVPALFARPEARALPAAERHVIVDAGRRQVDHTMPAAERRLKSEAYFKDVVQMPDDSPNGVSFATATASS